MKDFILGCIGLTIDFFRAVGQEIYHERSCAMKTDDVPHRCTCKRNKAIYICNGCGVSQRYAEKCYFCGSTQLFTMEYYRRSTYICNRCSRLQLSDASCDSCGWGDLYPWKG